MASSGQKPSTSWQRCLIQPASSVVMVSVAYRQARPQRCRRYCHRKPQVVPVIRFQMWEIAVIALRRLLVRLRRVGCTEIGKRLGDMDPANLVGSVQLVDGGGDGDGVLIGPRRHDGFLGVVAQEFEALTVRRGRSLMLARRGDPPFDRSTIF